MWTRLVKFLQSKRVDCYLLFIALFIACSPIAYDFNTDTDVCNEIFTTQPTCSALLGCNGTIRIGTAQSDNYEWCDMSDHFHGGAKFQPFDTDMDVYLWSSPEDSEELLALDIYTDSCTGEPVNGEQECVTGSWIFSPNISKDKDVFVHVAAEAATSLDIGYQFQPSNGWEGVIPPSDEQISCSHMGNDHLSLELFYQMNPPKGRERIDVADFPPQVDGEPRICGASTAGYRQVGYLIRNSSDADVLLKGLSLLRESNSVPVDFNIGVFRCEDFESTGMPPLDALGVNCSGSGDELDIVLKKLSQTDGDYDFVFILQIPPWEGEKFVLDFDTVEIPE